MPTSSATATGRYRDVPPLVSLAFSHLSPDGQYPQVVVRCHYSLREWDRSHHGAWHLYGHAHGTLPPLGKSLDVGVDVYPALISLRGLTALLRS